MMKIVAGMSSIDDYIRLVKAGADEVFCGFVPYEWNKRYKSLFPLNRREVLYYNVQISSYEDMRILKKMMDKYGCPVSITFNYLYYLKEQYDMIFDIISKLSEIGFKEYIIADISLIIYLRSKNIDVNIQLSGEAAELNRLSVDFLNQFNPSRYIFHRKNTIDDMKSIISENKIKNLEYEAFILNEKCHYTGAFCSSLHCDELSHLCKVNYILAKRDENSFHFKEVDSRIERYESEEDFDDEVLDCIGNTGCGLCHLKELKDVGITHLKVVGRGNHIENIERDIKYLKYCLNIMYDEDSSCTFKDKMQQEIFDDGCSHCCYY